MSREIQGAIHGANEGISLRAAGTSMSSYGSKPSFLSSFSQLASSGLISVLLGHFSSLLSWPRPLGLDVFLWVLKLQRLILLYNNTITCDMLVSQKHSAFVVEALVTWDAFHHWMWVLPRLGSTLSMLNNPFISIFQQICH